MNNKRWILVALFLLGRLILISTQSLDGLRGLGDFIHYYQINVLGVPYLDYWSEFPPIFPYLSLFVYQLAAGYQHIYEYLLILILSIAQAGSLYVFIHLLERLHPSVSGGHREWVYFVILSTLPYGWWYFDSLAVFFMLLGLTWLLDRKLIHAGIILAVGILIKFFPALLAPVALRRLTAKQATIFLAIAMGLILTVCGGLYLKSPQFTIASLRSQASKGSWETPWALLDGNYNTGNFGPEIERLDPELATRPRYNPARVPAWVTFIFFGSVGLWILMRSNLEDRLRATAFLGLTWCLFLFWTPGYSPQWVLYLIPLILLVAPEVKAYLLSFALVFVNILEWPILLSRGYNWGLWFTIALRMILLGILLYEFYQKTRAGRISHPELEGRWKTAGQL